VSGAAGSTPPKIVSTFRWIPDKGEAGQLYTSIAWWVTPDLSIGADYRIRTEDLNANVTWRAVSEDPSGWRPAVIMGSSVDDYTLGNDEIESRAYFATASKSILGIDTLHTSFSPYAGAVYVDELGELRPLVGLNVGTSIGSILVQYSGTDVHLSVTRSLGNGFSISGILWGMDLPGVGLRYSF